jgi:hypothetical protein
MPGKNSFLEIVKNLETKEENQGYIILIRCGAFFISIGANAIILSEELGLKTTCMVKGICKIGIPINSLYDYIKRLEKLDYSFVIYNYSKDEMIENGKRYAEAYRNKGKFILKEQVTIKCEQCEKYKKSFDNINIFEELKKLQTQKEKERNEENQKYKARI